MTELSVFLLARQLIRENILVLDTRSELDFKTRTRLRCAIHFSPALMETPLAKHKYERVIAYGPNAKTVVKLFSAEHHNIFTKDPALFAAEFPEHCITSLSPKTLAETLKRPGVLPIDTRKNGSYDVPRIRNAIHYLMGIGFTGWDRIIFESGKFKEVLIYGPHAATLIDDFPETPVSIYTGSLQEFFAAYPEFCFDISTEHERHHSDFAHPGVVCIDTSGFYIGNLATPNRVFKDLNINHIVALTRAPGTYGDLKALNTVEESSCAATAPPPSSTTTANGTSLAPPVIGSPPSSPGMPKKEAPSGVPPVLSEYAQTMKVLHMKEDGASIWVAEGFHVKYYSGIRQPTTSDSPGSASPSSENVSLGKETKVDLNWIVALLKDLIFEKKQKVAVLCELGIARSTAVAVAYLHLVKSMTPAEALNSVSGLCECFNPTELLAKFQPFFVRNSYSSPYKDLVVSKILPHLYCGSLQSLCGSRKNNAKIDLEALKRNRITHILSLGEKLEEIPGVQILYIEIDDCLKATIVSQFTTIFWFLDQALQTGGVAMVHCLAGVSRTGAVVIGYLMGHSKMSIRDAFRHAWRRRPILQPNDGFLVELFNYEKEALGQESMSIVEYKDFEMAHRWCLRWGV